MVRKGSSVRVRWRALAVWRDDERSPPVTRSPVGVHRVARGDLLRGLGAARRDAWCLENTIFGDNGLGSLTGPVHMDQLQTPVPLRSGPRGRVGQRGRTGNATIFVLRVLR